MNQLYPNDLLLKQIQIAKLVDWIKNKGWELMEHPNEKLFVFTWRDLQAAQPLTLIVPRREDFQDTPLRLAEAINLLASVHSISPYTLLAAVSSAPQLRSAQERLERTPLKLKQVAAMLFFIGASVLKHLSFTGLWWDVIVADIQALAIYAIVKTLVDGPLIPNHLESLRTREIAGNK